MAVLTSLLLIGMGLFFGWSGWTILRRRHEPMKGSGSPYTKTPLNRALLMGTARIAVVVGPAIALLGAAMLMVEISP